jgi:hypothetical protein
LDRWWRLRITRKTILLIFRQYTFSRSQGRLQTFEKSELLAAKPYEADVLDTIQGCYPCPEFCLEKSQNVGITGANLHADRLDSGMDRDETVALFLQGKEAWNTWAKKMLAERQAMEADGRWSIKVSAHGMVEFKNDTTAEWFNAAAVDFSRCNFFGKFRERKVAIVDQEGADVSKELMKIVKVESPFVVFSGFIFPDTSCFDGALFESITHFNEAIFKGTASFENATFKDYAEFDVVSFETSSSFRRVTFEKYVTFIVASFSGDAEFREAKLDQGAAFGGTTFSSLVHFDDADFAGEADFDGVTFSHHTSFHNAKFTARARFENCQFKWKAVFSGIKASEPFSLIGSRFEIRVPNFISAKFAEPVLLDNIRFASGIEPGGFLRSVFGGLFLWLNNKLDTELCAKYRQLKRMAKASDDHRNEQLFFRGELRSRRYTADKPWHPAFWLNVFYEAVSDCGIAVVRPLLIWLAITLGFAAFYLSQTGAVQSGLGLENASAIGATIKTAFYAVDNPTPCLAIGEGAQNHKPYRDGLKEEVGRGAAGRTEALQLSFRNAFIFLDGGVDAARRTYSCLYGVEMYAGSNPIPYVPTAVTTATAIQKLSSAIMIFLLGLALRNLLKMA